MLMDLSAYELPIDPALWQGETLAQQLAAHFLDVVETKAFKAFLDRRRSRDPTISFEGWRRAFRRDGCPVLVALLIWKGQPRQWFFPLLSSFVAPDSGHAYMIFEAHLTRVGLDTGYVLRRDIYLALRDRTWSG